MCEIVHTAARSTSLAARSRCRGGLGSGAGLAGDQFARSLWPRRQVGQTPGRPAMGRCHRRHPRPRRPQHLGLLALRQGQLRQFRPAADIGSSIPRASSSKASAPACSCPAGIAVDRDGNVYVADADGKNGKGDVVVKFSPDGKVLMTLGRAGTLPPTARSTSPMVCRRIERASSSSHPIVGSSGPRRVQRTAPRRQFALLKPFLTAILPRKGPGIWRRSSHSG